MLPCYHAGLNGDVTHTSNAPFLLTSDHDPCAAVVGVVILNYVQYSCDGEQWTTTVCLSVCFALILLLSGSISTVPSVARRRHDTTRHLTAPHCTASQRPEGSGNTLVLGAAAGTGSEHLFVVRASGDRISLRISFGCCAPSPQDKA